MPVVDEGESSQARLSLADSCLTTKKAVARLPPNVFGYTFKYSLTNYGGLVYSEEIDNKAGEVCSTITGAGNAAGNSADVALEVFGI